MYYCYLVYQSIRGFAGAQSSKDKQNWVTANPGLWNIWQKVQELKLGHD